MCLFVVLSTPCFNPFVLIFLFEKKHLCLGSVISFFLVLFLVHHFLFPPTKLFSLFHSVRLFVSLRKKTNFLFTIVVSSILTTFLDPIFCFLSLSLSLFSSFVFSLHSLLVFHVSFYCLCFFSFFSVPCVSLSFSFFVFFENYFCFTSLSYSFYPSRVS